MKRYFFKKTWTVLVVMIFLALLALPAGVLAAPEADESPLGVAYRGHVQNKGDMPKPVGSLVEGPDPIGTRGESLRVEGFWIVLTGDVPDDAGIMYEVHVQNRGWMEPVINGDFAGTKGESLRIEAIKISLLNLPDYDLYYRGHVENRGDIPVIDGNPDDN